MVIVENKPVLTKFDDPAQTREMALKAQYATKTTCAIFNYLNAARIPTSFIRQLSNTEFLAKETGMLQLEVVVRAVLAGSAAKRRPDLPRGNRQPRRFSRLWCEFFIKTTKGIIRDKNGREIGKTPVDQDTKRPVEDPLIADHHQKKWKLMHPKIPESEKGADLECTVSCDDILPDGVTVEMIEELARKIFLLLEGAFAKLGKRLIDFKVEFGIDASGNLVLSDVLDNDSWRLEDIAEGKEFSKELFRQDAGMDLIEDSYRAVSEMVQLFHVPKQALVIWRYPHFIESTTISLRELPGLDVVEVDVEFDDPPIDNSNRLFDIVGRYPEGGVIIFCGEEKSGRPSVLSKYTSWPTIVVMPDTYDYSFLIEDKCPIMAVPELVSAVPAALNMLAKSNPVVYAYRQYAVEEFLP